jgi:hypothetical protein
VFVEIETWAYSFFPSKRGFLKKINEINIGLKRPQIALKNGFSTLEILKKMTQKPRKSGFILGGG